MNVTIEQLEAKHSELADLIAKFRAQPAPSRVLGFTAEISLADGDEAWNAAAAHAQGLRERIAELEAHRVPQWISVTERMPEPNSGEVLVWLTGGGCAFDEWHMHREDPTGMSTTHTIEMGLMWRDYEHEDITHWMPLPPPPVERAHGVEPNTTTKD